MAELEKLGPKYRIALRIARDERWERIQCDHKGVYADDCECHLQAAAPKDREWNQANFPTGIVDRVQKHKVYIVATNGN